MGMAAILFKGTKPFEQIVNILSTEGPILCLVRNWSSGFREDYKDIMILYTYIAQR